MSAHTTAPTTPANESTAPATALGEAAAMTMRAIVQDRYGEPRVLRVAEIPIPTAGNDEVLLRVDAAGIDKGTLHLLLGTPYIARLASGLRRPKRRVPGLDVSGTVVAVGSGVTRFRVGDRVFGIAKGSLAEYAVALEKKLAHVPNGHPSRDFAAVPVSGLTALQSVDTIGQVQADQRVLILGASGGVGSYAVQLAKAAGAHVTAVCSAVKADFVRSLGADEVVSYQARNERGGLETLSTAFDVIVDIGGNTSLRRLSRMVRSGGTVVLVGGDTGGKVTAGYGKLLRAPFVSLLSSARIRSFVAKEDGADMQRLAERIASGAIRIPIDRTYALDDAPLALTHLREGRVKGKIIVTL